MPRNTNKENVTLDLVDGTRVSATLFMQDGYMHIDVGWFGHFVIEPESAAVLGAKIVIACKGAETKNGETI